MSDLVIRPDDIGTPDVSIKVNVTGGTDGATFTPAVSDEGVLSWSNNAGLENPEPVDVKGPKGDPGVSSWNDLTDKPFGEVEVEILPETEVTFEYMEDAGMNLGLITLTNVPEEGAECTVVYNGETYSCIVTGGLLGNFGVVTGGEDTGEPFIVSVAENAGGQFVVPLTEITSATVSITSKAVQTIPDEYMPSDVLFINLTSLGEITVNGFTDVEVSVQITPEQLGDAIEQNKRIKLRFKTIYRPSGTVSLTDVDTIVDLYATNAIQLENEFFLETMLWGLSYRFKFINQETGFYMDAQAYRL